MRSNEVGIADAEICHSGDICKIFRSRYCVKILSNLFGFRTYTHTNPMKTLRLKNRSINSFIFVRTLICKTVQISVDRTSILLVFQTKKECRPIPLDLILHSFNLFIHFVSIADLLEHLS